MLIHSQRTWSRVAFIAGILAINVIAVRAATLVWDANGSAGPNPSDGNGSWLASGRWWNGSANQTWADGNDAVFGIGSGSVAAYLVTNNAALVQPVSVSFT